MEIRRYAADPLGGQTIAPQTMAALRRSKGGGAGLPGGVAHAAGAHLGRDLSQVRVHTGPEADTLARSVQSVAFTHGSDIYFSRGTYAPGTSGGDRLLAHELAHVVEDPTGTRGVVGRADDPAEAAADRVADGLAPALRRSVHTDHGPTDHGPTDHGPTDHGPTDRADHTATPDGPRRLRRRISKTAGDINALRPVSERLKAMVVSDTLSRLGRMLKDYAAERSPGAQDGMLDGIMALCDYYLSTHDAGGDKSEAKRVALVEDIKAEAFRDKGQLQAQQRYLTDAYGKDALGTKATTPLAQQQQSGVTHAATKAAVGKGPASGGLGGAPEDAARLASKYGLSEAEILALKTYTASDYTYINPATANAPGWMAAQNPGKDQGQLKEEGSLHAGVMMSGLDKMKKQKGKVYRGARMTQKEFDDRYGSQTQIVFSAFTSSATQRGPAQNFADGMGDAKPKADQTISVMCVLDVNNARDVRELSIYGSGEQEWLLLPGSTFQIASIKDEGKGKAGSPPATVWKTVLLTQTR